MTDYPIALPDKLLDRWSKESHRIENQDNLKHVVRQALRRDLFTEIANWGAWTYNTTPKQRLARLIYETGNEELMEAFNQMEES